MARRPKRWWCATLREVALESGIPLRTLEKWRATGRIPGKTGRGWSVKRALDAAREAAEAEDAVVMQGAPGVARDATEEWRRAKAELAKLDLAERRRELVRRDSVREQWLRWMELVLSELENMPRRGAELLEGAGGLRDRERLLDGLVGDVVARLNHAAEEVWLDGPGGCGDGGG